MGKGFYKLATAAIRIFSHRMKTEWEVPFEEGPCVFVVNNVGFMGPCKEDSCLCTEGLLVETGNVPGEDV